MPFNFTTPFLPEAILISDDLNWTGFAALTPNGNRTQFVVWHSLFSACCHCATVSRVSLGHRADVRFNVFWVFFHTKFGGGIVDEANLSLLL
ncbi:unnamed protein product [Protopolystoma xenopodis]|uniref:Uncharacterized protein n=1 Tax=Protopolystoma xenopodis TaxID=117903 RepID=A0A448XH78_9PLAT|nr:unnamed protein product [Protopolystoma xenopodis]